METSIERADTDIRSDYEKARDARWAEVRGRFVDLRKMNPLAKPCRLFAVVAKQFGMTVQGVRRICVRGGVYVPKNGRAEAGEARS